MFFFSAPVSESETDKEMPVIKRKSSVKRQDGPVKKSKSEEKKQSMSDDDDEVNVSQATLTAIL